MSFYKISETTFINLSNVFSIAAAQDGNSLSIKMLDGSEVSILPKDIYHTVATIERMGGSSFVEISDGSLFVDPTKISKVEQVTSSLTVIKSTSRANVQTVMSALSVVMKIPMKDGPVMP
jgi:hypothetical protein